MEPLSIESLNEQKGSVACCECGTPITPNPANMCLGCLRCKVDITEGIQRQSNLQHCKFCNRYLVPPNSWQTAELESKELLSLCLRRSKPALAGVRLVDASFIWTEPHSKRVKVKITIQKEIYTNAVLQQSLVIEYVICGQVCEDCHRVQAKDFWRACVQVRQKCEYKRTLFYLEQMILKHNAAATASNIKPVPTGIDFFFPKQQDARKLVDFIQTFLPLKYNYSQQLISQDVHNNTYDYKHTFCVEICPITKDSLICLPKKLAQMMGNLGQLVICLRITNVITVMDPLTLQVVDVNSAVYFKNPFEIFMDSKMMIEFYVIDKEEIQYFKRGAGHSHVSPKHQLSHVWVMRSSEVGSFDAQTYSVRTHLGKVLRIGDTVMGYYLTNTNINNPIFDEISDYKRPDVILVRKVEQKGCSSAASTADDQEEIPEITQEMADLLIE